MPFVPDSKPTAQPSPSPATPDTNLPPLSSPIERSRALLQKASQLSPQKPVTGMEDPVYQLLGLTSGGTSAGAGSTLRKIGDFLMQKGAGASKLIPGLGEAMASEGMIGTKAALARQAEQGLERSGAKISELANQIPNQISQDQVANKVAEVASSKMTPTGFVRPEEQAAVDRALSKAQDFAQSPSLDPAEMAARRAQAGKAAREAGAYKMQPSQQLKAQLAAKEQAGYSQALKDAYGNAFPGSTNELAEADKSYSTFKQAQDLLDKPESVGTVKGFLGQFIPSTLMQTTAGRAAIGAGKGLQRIPKTAPISISTLIGNYNNNGTKSGFVPDEGQ